MQDSDYISYINVHSKNNRMLKAEFHTHVKGDPQDNISYSAKQLVDKAAELNYDVLAITCHNWVYEDQSIEEYAKNKNIILFRGIERDIENKHTLLYNITNDEAQKIFTFTDLKKAKESAQQSDELKTAFLANMSHEIRTPMNAIVGFSQLLNEEDISDDDKKQFIQLINSRSQDLLVLINDIVDISKVEAGLLKIVTKEC